MKMSVSGEKWWMLGWSFTLPWTFFKLIQSHCISFINQPLCGCSIWQIKTKQEIIESEQWFYTEVCSELYLFHRNLMLVLHWNSILLGFRSLQRVYLVITILSQVAYNHISKRSYTTLTFDRKFGWKSLHTVYYQALLIISMSKTCKYFFNK